MPTQLEIGERQKRVDTWNQLHPVGTRVSFKNDLGGQTTTVTTRKAALSGRSNIPVVWLRGFPGPHNLDRITVEPTGN